MFCVLYSLFLSVTDRSGDDLLNIDYAHFSLRS